MIELAGGLDALMTRAQAALAGGDEQWAVELVGHVLSLEPEHPDARRIRSEALRALGEAEISANGRNYYLTQAREAAGVLQTPRTDPAVAGRQLAQDLPMSALFASMSVALLAEEAIGLDVVIGFHFTDTAEHWSLHVRHAVAVVRQHRPEAAVARLSIPASLFKQMMIGARKPATTLARSEVSIEGDKLKLMTTLALFEATA